MTTMTTEYMGWHFLRADSRLNYNDGREARVGGMLTVPGPLVIRKSGLHASARALDALRYAMGPIVCRVRLSGEVLQDPEHTDKVCATERTVLAMMDATNVLREYVRDTLVVRQPHLVSLFNSARLPNHAAAIAALDMGTDSLAVIEQVCDDARVAAWDSPWIRGNDARSSVRAAASTGASTAARAAARAAARDAASNAIWDAIWDTASTAIWAAASTGASTAARAATWDDLNARLEARLLAALREPA